MKRKLLTLAVLSTLPVVAMSQVADFADASFIKSSGTYEYENFTLTSADQTQDYRFGLGNSASLTVNKDLTVNVARQTSSEQNLLGLFVWSNTAKLDVKGNTLINVENNGDQDDQFVIGINSQGTLNLDGDSNQIKVVNNAGNNTINGIFMPNGTLTAKNLLVDVVNNVAMPADGSYANSNYGIWQSDGTIATDNLTINVKGKGIDNFGIAASSGTATLGTLTIKASADAPESDWGTATATGLYIVPSNGNSKSGYTLTADVINIEAASLQGGDAYGIYAEWDEETNAPINITAKKTDIRITKAYDATGVNLSADGATADLVTAKLGDLTLNLQADNRATGIETWGGTVTMGSLGGEILAKDNIARGIYADGSSLTVNGDVQLKLAGIDADGLALRYGSHATFNGKVQLAVEAYGGSAQGIVNDYRSQMTFNDFVDVSVINKVVDDKTPNQLFGVDVDNEGSQVTFKKGLKVTTSGVAKNIYHVALNAKEGKILVEGGADIAAEEGYLALKAIKGGEITITEDADTKTTIKGNVWVNGADSAINVALSAGDSLTARSATQANGAFNLSLKDGGVWNVGKGGSSSATTIKSDGGHLAFTDKASSLNVNSLELTNTTLVSMNDVPAEGGHYITAGTVTGDGSVRAEGSGEMNDARTGALADVIDSTANAVFGEAGSDKVSEVYLAEGKLFGEVEATLQKDGSYNITERANTKLESVNSLAILSAMQWRHDMNDLTKRMGELRMSPEGIGGWARLYGSEQEYAGITAKNSSIQVGSDVDVGAGWKVGAAFSYTDGSADMSNGTADNKAYGLAAYGTWMAEDGQFVDLIAKYNKLDTDYTVKGVDGSFDNNAWSFSAEYGWHFKLNDITFIEPQAELTFGQVFGDDFVNGEGVRLEQKDFESLIGRVGVRAGYFFPNNKGVIYARASVLHDFKGDAETVASYNGRSVSFKDDLGSTWGEIGLGANFKLTDTTYTYVDLEKTTGGDLSEKYRWNIGVRHVF